MQTALLRLASAPGVGPLVEVSADDPQNAFDEVQNVGLGAHRIDNGGGRTWGGGSTYPLVVGDWAMAYGRDAHGWVEGLLMLNFEPLTVGPAGYPELGQSGEGLWDAQHSHQLVHQAMVGVHPLSGIAGWHPEGMRREGSYDLTVFGGQGSATIGPPNASTCCWKSLPVRR